MIDEVGLNEKPEDTTYIEMRPEAPGVLEKDLILSFAIIGNCRLGNGQVCHSLEDPGRG